MILNKQLEQGFPGGSVVENLPAKAGDSGSIPGLEDLTCGQQLNPSATATEPEF